MDIPQFVDFFPPFIESLKDGKIHSLREILEHCAEVFGLTDEDRQKKLPSGTQAIFYNRVGWAGTYLKKANLVESPSRGNFLLTDAGKEALKHGSENVNLEYLRKRKTFSEWREKSVNSLEASKEKKCSAEHGESPRERMDSAFNELNSVLADELMARTLKMSPYAFEDLVVKLLVKMGYGDLNESSVTKKSGDEGIDGIVAADKFGFDSIYIQAKRWGQDQTVGRPEIQRFVGALASQGATKGLFITTAKFSKEAIECAQKPLNCKLVLVDGDKLMKLMIEYNLGVATDGVPYEIKRIDSDFFEEDL